MAAIGAAVGTAVIAGIVTKLISFTVGEAVKVAKKFRQGDLVEELKSLELKLKLMTDLLDDAESNQNKQPGVKAWLEELKDSAYDAEDVLDKYLTSAAILQRRKGPMKWIKGKVNTRGLKNKIKRINNRLKGLSDQINNLGLQKLKTCYEGNTSGSQGRDTSSLVDMDWPIIGRDGVQQEIIGLLKSDETENITKKLPVLAIVGMGGLGKTSLARSVFHDVEVEIHFSLRIWVFVSQEFDPRGMLRKIIEIGKGVRKQCAFTTLESLQDETKKMIANKKFLLILDDAWNEETQRWEELLKPLKFGNNGSKVLVTTRNKNVAKSIDGHMDPIMLGAMNHNHIWKILEGRAFMGIDNPTNKENLINVGKQIAKKLNGSPLAAKMIGRLLGTKLDENYWKSILQSDLGKVEGQQEHDILPSLRLSYQYLPPMLKFCFSLCSLFPKGHQICKAKLSYMWIAHDIFQDVHGKEPENLAEEALQHLINRSLLFQGKDDDHVVMHELIHDVSEFVAQEDHLHITDSIKFEKQLTKKMRHWSFSNMNWEPRLSCDKLRSILAFSFDCDFTICERVLNRCLHGAKYLRVLDFPCSKINVLPKSIGKLKHLRYLNLSDTGISKLPKSLTSLYNLQALWLENCSKLKKLPDGMGNMVNLRLLRADKELVHTINDIGRLGFLRELTDFHVDPKNGWEIEELENLDMLGGKLVITCLEDVANPVKARKACLERKKHLQGLTLEWSVNNTATNQKAKEVLEALLPNHYRLKCLAIKNYKGRVSASWLTNDNFYSLEQLKLDQCPEIQSLMTGMALPRSLKMLSIEECENFQGLPSDMTWLTSLQSLELCYCPKIQSLAETRLPASIERLEIHCCESFTSLSSDMSRLTSLRTLKLYNCPRLPSFPEGGLPVSLLDLHVVECPALRESEAARKLISHIPHICWDEYD